MLSCGWPNGPHKEDGFCGEQPTVAYLIRVHVHNIPLIDSEDEGHEAALMLCRKHAPVDEPVG